MEDRANDEDQNQGSDDENSNNLLLSNGKLKQNLVNGELGEIRKTLNDLKSCVESLTGKKITNHNDSGSAGTGDSDDAQRIQSKAYTGTHQVKRLTSYNTNLAPVTNLTI